MKIEIELTENELINELENFFNKNKSNPKIWCATALGKYLKKKLDELGYWKNAPRGNSKLGYIKMREKINSN
jgi:DNA-binding XRE family transcriptional regulator